MSDIRHFLCKKRKTDDTTATPSSSTDHQKEDDSNFHADDELRLKLLRKPWIPSQTYNFKKDVNLGAKRRGLQGQFIVSPCLKYHKFYEAAQSHATTQCHRDAIVSSKNFEKIMDRQQLSVHEALDSAYHKEVEENRVKLRSIISTILFCGQHDLPLRGKSDEGSVFTDLLHFRIESRDKILKNHLESGAKNSLYISHQIQNDFIQTCSDVLKGKIIEEVKHASVFSVLADETADISGTEQLSIGVRYLRCDQKNKKPIICEEFLGFVSLQALNSKSISETIIRFLENCDLNLNRLIGQGYDGCAAMVGHISGVQKLINDKYPMALFFHCASHTLNLVINDLNDVNEVRNTAGTTKEIINFFRESTLRRNMIPNIPLFCETRWSVKYKSIRIFSENFSKIVRALKELSENAPNSKTKVKAHKLYTTATTPTYIVTLLVIAIYSAKLEPVCNQLQQLHPDAMKKLDEVSFRAVAENINSLYGDTLSNFIAEITTWYEMWKNEATTNESFEYADLICQATPFYPAIAEAIKIGLTLPATTCSIERSFSTLRRVKTWNRSTMGDERLSGLCILSVHRKRVQEDTEFIDNVTNEFGKQPRRLKFLFQH
ncbi:zinc finger MYM-type protein 1-like [Ooceraea biroi]|uniref:zinc finger MYM-type protein 1-like n=1 Tax=Ooceraea biroi TaxID=2015173 RepID=UPI000F07690C|nr:zinc finger MYM-type protein 1-like [Ooceraea biroi]